MKFKFLIVLMILVLSFNVIADDYRVEYPNYMDVDEVERVYFYDEFDDGDVGYLFLNGVNYLLDYNTTENYFYKDLTSSVEEDVFATFLAVINNTEVANSTTNMTPTSYYDVRDDNRYVFTKSGENNYSCSQTIQQCYYLNSVGQDSQIQIEFAQKNMSTNLTWYTHEDLLIVPQDSPGIYCEGNDIFCPTGNLTTYVSMRCVNCDNHPNRYVQIGTNNDNSDNRSGYFDLSDDQTYINLDEEFIMYRNFIRGGAGLHDPISVVLKFREPFYYDIELYKLNDTGNGDVEQYVNNFNYIYMKLENSTIRSVPNSYDVNRFFTSTLGWMPGIENLYGSNIDMEEVFWGDYDSGTTTIKLYENGTYSVNLLTLDISGYDWNYEFVKPQYSNIKLDTKLTEINITDESDASIKIFADEWEFDKVGVVINIMKTIIIVLLVLVGLGLVTFLPGGSKLVGVLAPAGIALALKILGIL